MTVRAALSAALSVALGRSPSVIIGPMIGAAEDRRVVRPTTRPSSVHGNGSVTPGRFAERKLVLARHTNDRPSLEAQLSTRFALLVATAALIVTACGASAVTTLAPATPTPVPAQPNLTPVPGSTEEPIATPAPPEGDVDGAQEGAPELAIESDGTDSLEISVADSTAKAWRIRISGTNEADRLELIVETSDIAPGIHVDEIVGNEVVATDDLTRMPDEPTVAAGGCHRTVGVCFSSDGIKLDDANGVLTARFTFRDPSAPIAITGSTAGWPAEPFILGDWHDSQTFKSWE
jgi:hypothetical protein